MIDGPLFAAVFNLAVFTRLVVLRTRRLFLCCRPADRASLFLPSGFGPAGAGEQQLTPNCRRQNI